MAGDNQDAAQNVNIWKNAAVWVAEDEAAKVGIDGSFGEDWANVGVLAEGSEIGQEFETDRNDINGFGGGLITTDQKFTKDVRTFTALEDNATTQELIWPNSYRSKNGSLMLRKPKDAQKIVAFETVNQRGEKVIEVTRVPANIYPGGLGKGDDGADSKEFTVEVRPDREDNLYESHTFDGTDAPKNVEFIRFEIDEDDPEPIEDEDDEDNGSTPGEDNTPGDDNEAGE